MTVSYELKDHVALIGLDDGKANAVSPALLKELNRALDQAEKEADAVVLTGRPGRFSAGFDLSVMGQGGDAMVNLVAEGAKLSLRLLEFPLPVVIACSGHALAMGGLLLLSADFRIGVEGGFKIGLNEVAIGMTMPFIGVELGRGRLHVPYFHRAVTNAEIFSPDAAVAAGFLDQVATETDLMAHAIAAAQQLSQLNRSAHHNTKLRVRAPMLNAIRDGVQSEFGIILN